MFPSPERKFDEASRSWSDVCGDINCGAQMAIVAIDARTWCRFGMLWCRVWYCILVSLSSVLLSIVFYFSSLMSKAVIINMVQYFNLMKLQYFLCFPSYITIMKQCVQEKLTRFSNQEGYQRNTSPTHQKCWIQDSLNPGQAWKYIIIHFKLTWGKGLWIPPELPARVISLCTSSLPPWV